MGYAVPLKMAKKTDSLTWSNLVWSELWRLCFLHLSWTISIKVKAVLSGLSGQRA